MNESKNWDFTLFEKDDYKFTDFHDRIFKVYQLNDISYYTYGMEECPTSGRLHLQGMIQFTTKKRMAKAKKMLQCKHISLRPLRFNSTMTELYDYTGKQTRLIEMGEVSKQGDRNDIKQIIEDAKTKTYEQIWEEDNYTAIKYSRLIKEQRAMMIKKASKKFRNVEVIVYWGEAGTGKSRKVYEEIGDEYYKHDIANNKNWWNGYDGENAIWIDDFKGCLMPYTYLLNILDGYPLRLETKGSFTYANWEKVYITSNFEIADWYPNIENNEPLMRRIKICAEVK